MRKSSRQSRIEREMQIRMDAWDALQHDLDVINQCKYLTMTQKHILCELTSLAVKDGFCRAGNVFLSQKWSISKSQVSSHIKKLKEEEFIRIEYEDRERHIFINFQTVLRKKNESRRASLFIPAKYTDFFDHFADVPSWRRDRKLNQALKEYVRACLKVGIRVKKVDVKKQAQYLIDQSGGNIQGAISIVDKAVDEGRQIVK